MLGVFNIGRVSEISNFTLQFLNLEYLSNAVISRIIEHALA